MSIAQRTAQTTWEGSLARRPRCPVSRLFAGAKVTVEAFLDQ